MNQPTAQLHSTAPVFSQLLSSTRGGARLARLLTVTELRSWGIAPHITERAESIVAELAANAVFHGYVKGRDSGFVSRGGIRPALFVSRSPTRMVTGCPSWGGPSTAKATGEGAASGCHARRPLGHGTVPAECQDHLGGVRHGKDMKVSRMSRQNTRCPAEPTDRRQVAPRLPSHVAGASHQISA
ncbi:hypothetical protein ACH4LT_02535 [Streptomyces clavifer]|uniref:hypothetical protein n=1 Tax=Streptomyces clavifer TaxID=68188 RepID=UPI003788EC20